ncbi:hypothetical protein Y032_0087g2067 [Ancylostoma ceylanicum]|nr:hypothetical protein Y032_0087g2067 [Ancylostoma ceylanicum]
MRKESIVYSSLAESAVLSVMRLFLFITLLLTAVAVSHATQDVSSYPRVKRQFGWGWGWGRPWGLGGGLWGGGLWGGGFYPGMMWGLFG